MKPFSTIENPFAPEKHRNPDDSALVGKNFGCGGRGGDAEGSHNILTHDACFYYTYGMTTTTRTIEIPVREYTLLKKKANALEAIVYFVRMRPEFFEIPPVRSRKKIISAFRKTRKYSNDFLQSLQKGLQRSTFFSA